jgi:hypothetical protein
LDALLFQAAEEGFGDRIVPAVAAPAHAGFERMGGAEPLEVVATILATLVGMHQDASVGFAAPDGHEEGIQRQFAAQRRLHGPAHHLAGVQVQHHGKVQPALPCPDVGDVGDPDLVGRVDGESLLQAIGREEGWAAGKRPRLPVAADGPDLVAPHEPLDTMQAAGLAHFPQVAEHPASPVNLMTARRECRMSSSNRASSMSRSDTGA